MNNKKIPALAFVLISAGCSNSAITVFDNVNISQVKTNVKALASSPASSLQASALPAPNKFESFPDTSVTASLEDKYNLQKYIQANKILDTIPLTSVDNYKVQFTSDGGAVFSVKAESENQEYIWKRKAQKLLFDNFQLVNIIQNNNETTYYSRYSQLIENDITVNSTNLNFTKKANLVQTVGLSLKKENTSYKIANFTPVVIRQVEKSSLPFKIDKLTLKAENIPDLNLEGEKTLIPWPGVSFNNYRDKKKLTVAVSISSDQTDKRSLAILLSLQGTQYQLNKVSDSLFSADIDLPVFNTGKSSLVLELIDKQSLEENSKFQGYTWVVPYIISP